MKNTIETLIAQNQALNNELTEAIDARFLLLMEDLLPNGANPNWIPTVFGNSFLSEILNWYEPDMVAAVKLLLAYQANPNFDIPERGSILHQIKTQITDIQSKMYNFNDNECQQHIATLTTIADLLSAHGAIQSPLLESNAKPPFFKRGNSNPEQITENIYFYIIANQLNPTQLSQLFDLTTATQQMLNTFHKTGVFDLSSGKLLWNYDRFGTSRTILPDGGIVFIGGEHEDYYDSDFCIFNDVLHVDKSGKMQLFFYLERDFPPTDFHSATYWKGNIIIIGNCGYHNRRELDQTPVYQLRLTDFSIKKLHTKGTNPGWIYKHNAMERDGSIFVWGGTLADSKEVQESSKMYRLDLKTLIWSLL
jgi:hypothetical protein